MDREIRIKIGKDGRVEIDSTVFTDCKNIAEHLSRVLGAVESFSEKDSFNNEVKINIDNK